MVEIQKKNIQGSCLCGQLHYSLKNPPILSGYCHCDACKQRSNGPFAGFMMTFEKDFNLTGQYHVHRETGGSGQPMIAHRCSVCGTVVFTELKVLSNILAINASTLFQTQEFKPQIHVWVNRKSPHITLTDDLPKEPGPPKALSKHLAQPTMQSDSTRYTEQPD